MTTTEDPVKRALTMIGAIQRLLEGLEITPPIAKPNNRPKLTKGDVKRVFIMRRNGCTVADIAECFDVNKSTISRTLKGVYH